MDTPQGRLAVCVIRDLSERARKAVTARIKDALARIATVHPALADHLTESISTGSLCAYRPAEPTRWQS